MTSYSDNHPKLPNGIKFQAGSLLESPKGLQFYVTGMLAPSTGNTDPLVLMEPLKKIPGDPDMPQGEMLSAMGEWIVVRFEPK